MVLNIVLDTVARTQSKQTLKTSELPLYRFGQRSIISVLPLDSITSNILTSKNTKDKS